MAFKYEVVELANGIIDTLRENKFFEETPFVGETELLQKLKENMQRKWETDGEMLLTDNEFIETCNEVMHESLTDTLGTLLDKEAIEMSIGADGEIYYSANSDFNIDKLLDDDV
jgi:hypothetical protein